MSVLLGILIRVNIALYKFSLSLQTSPQLQTRCFFQQKIVDIFVTICCDTH